jgi:hypothetical protein
LEKNPRKIHKSSTETHQGPQNAQEQNLEMRCGLLGEESDLQVGGDGSGGAVGCVVIEEGSARESLGNRPGRFLSWQSLAGKDVYSEVGFTREEEEACVADVAFIGAFSSHEEK